MGKGSRPPHILNHGTSWGWVIRFMLFIQYLVLSIHPSVPPFVCPSIHPAIHPSIHPSIPPSIFLPVCPPIYPPTQKIQVSLKQGTLDLCTFMVTSRLIFLEWEMFQTKVVDKVKTNILCCNTFFFLNHATYEMMWKNIVQAHRPRMKLWHMSISAGYISLQTHALRICNVYCFSTATMVTQIHLNVMLHIHCLSCYLITLTKLHWTVNLHYI